MCNNKQVNIKDAAEDLEIAIRSAKLSCEKVREYHRTEYQRVRHGW